MGGVSAALAQSGASGADPAKTILDELVAEAEQLRLILDLLRRRMGAPIAAPIGITAENVSMHDLVFQARSFHNRISRLCFETLRSEIPTPAAAPNADNTQEVLGLLRGAREPLTRIMTALLPGTAVPPARVEGGVRDPAQLFTTLQRLNKQTDMLLERPFTTADVYSRLTLAVGYAARILSLFPQADFLPTEPT